MTETNTIGGVKSLYNIPTIPLPTPMDPLELRSASSSQNVSPKKIMGIPTKFLISKTLLTPGSTPRSVGLWKFWNLILIICSNHRSINDGSSVGDGTFSGSNVQKSATHDGSCSSASSASSIQTQIDTGKTIATDETGGMQSGDCLSETPRLLGLGVSLSTPNLLNTTATLTISSNSSETDVSRFSL